MTEEPRRDVPGSEEPTAPLWSPEARRGVEPAGPSGPPPASPPPSAPPTPPQGDSTQGDSTQGFPTQGDPTQDYPAGVPAPLTRPLPEGGGRGPRRRGFVAGVVVAAMLVGGGAGVAGAAIYGASTDGGARPATTSPVVTADAPSSTGIQAVAEKVLPSTVKIDVRGGQQAGSGSGIILSSDGEILTNHHVVEVAGDGGRVVVEFNDGSSAEAEVVGTDPLTDTALLKAEDVSGLTPATIGSSAKLDVGEGVVAIGSPFGLDSTVTSGIVSALKRPVNVGSDGQGNATVYPAIQTDAAINPGNSGGALVDMNGNVVGINASIRTSGSGAGTAGSIGLGFAIPIDEVMPIIEQMRNGEEPTHALLGVSVSDNVQQGSNLSAGDGALVREVTDGGSADGAGLEKGDVITQVDDVRITTSDSLVAAIRAYRPEDEVKVTWTDDSGQEHSEQVTLGSD